MDVDHGMTQLLTQLFDWPALPPMLPVFVNCAAPPLPPLVRVQALGEALGAFVATRSERVLLTASGGLSHDPPIPVLAQATDPVRERLITGGTLSPEARAARQQRVIDDAVAQTAGASPRTPLNSDWDQHFLSRLAVLDFAAITRMDDASITRDGGCGGHEIRSWLAVAAAARAAGIASLDRRYYHAIPEWVAGYALMTAGPRL
jgi:2,3-dihydroxyphenylpropionate 1,2-dioxygenase